MDRIEMEQTIAGVDLLDLIGSDTRLVRSAATHGGEYHGPCPWCGGQDRFAVWPEEGRWWCRRCDRKGDAIDYIRERDGLSFGEAIFALGRGRMPTASGRTAGARVLECQPRPTTTEGWRAQARDIVSECERALWLDFGTRARDYLHSRGLRDETLHAWHIGFSRPLLIGHNGQRGQVIAGRWVPAGILLPWFDAGEIYEIKIRLPKRKPSANTRPDRAPKYAKVAGGDPVLFGSDHFAGWKQVVLAEGEFDAMLLWQEAGDLVDVASLGSASQQLEDRAVAKLLRYPTILTAYDRDGAGNTANERVGALSARMRQIAVPLGNDITDFWKLEGRLHDWIAFELARLEALQRSGSRPSEKLKNVIETQTIRRQAGPSPEPTVQDVGSEDSEDECHVSAAELAIEQAAKGALRNELAALGEGAVRIRVCQELSVLARHRCWRRLELNAGAYEVGAGCLVIPQGKEAWMAFLERASPLQIVAIRHYFASCSPAWPSTAG